MRTKPGQQNIAPTIQYTVSLIDKILLRYATYCSYLKYNYLLVLVYLVKI